jgi:hypothetical protein
MNDMVRKPYRFSEIYDCLARQLDVKYEYHETESVAKQDTELNPAMVASLPLDIRQRLHDALVSLNAEKIIETILELGRTDPVLAHTLKRLADNFDYPTILRLLDNKDS